MKELILISVFATWFTEMSFLPQYIKWWLCKAGLWYKTVRPLKGKKPTLIERSIKPFDCDKCLSFWIAVAYTLYIGYNPFEVLLYSAFTSALSITLTKLYKHDFSRTI